MCVQTACFQAPSRCRRRPRCSARPPWRTALPWNLCPSHVRAAAAAPRWERPPANSGGFFFSANAEKKSGRRKRRLIVDLNKELSDGDIREQISDSSDLVVAMDLAPPTLQLMLWKENGGAHRLLARPCSCVFAPQVMEVNAGSRRPKANHAATL